MTTAAAVRRTTRHFGLWDVYRNAVSPRRRHLRGVCRHPIAAVTVADVRTWVEAQTGRPATGARKVAAVRSLKVFGMRAGYLDFDVGRVVKLPRPERVLADCILSKQQVYRLFVAARRGATATASCCWCCTPRRRA
ncbi:MAG: hypothetical protein JOZ87_05655 [Chloroflexi bacterium]|nr:hypothetical protein [Chloroflexota bacterium]